MAVAISFNPSSPKLYATTTASVTGGTATTAYYLSIAKPTGHTQIVNFTTDGAGAASIPLVTSVSGTHTVNVFPVASVSAANGTFSTSGH